MQKKRQKKEKKRHLSEHSLRRYFGHNKRGDQGAIVGGASTTCGTLSGNAITGRSCICMSRIPSGCRVRDKSAVQSILQIILVATLQQSIRIQCHQIRYLVYRWTRKVCRVTILMRNRSHHTLGIIVVYHNSICAVNSIASAVHAQNTPIMRWKYVKPKVSSLPSRASLTLKPTI